MFRKRIKDMLEMMGISENVDEEILDSLQRQLFQFLEFDDSLAGGITFKTGSLVTTIHAQNYQEVRDEISEALQRGEPLRRLNLKLSLSSLCLYLTEEKMCQVTNESCPFQKNSTWFQCEIVQDSCKPTNEEWK
ncbi:hypothetical protein [Candidatus Hodarchaeum mangrovi]